MFHLKFLPCLKISGVLGVGFFFCFDFVCLCGFFFVSGFFLKCLSFFQRISMVFFPFSILESKKSWYVFVYLERKCLNLTTQDTGIWTFSSMPHCLKKTPHNIGSRWQIKQLLWMLKRSFSINSFCFMKSVLQNKRDRKQCDACVVRSKVHDIP